VTYEQNMVETDEEELDEDKDEAEQDHNQDHRLKNENPETHELT
jgi:hypothetical protein